MRRFWEKLKMSEQKLKDRRPKAEDLFNYELFHKKL